VERHEEGLAALALPEAQECPFKVDVVEPEQPDRGVAGGCRDEDRDDRSVAEIDRPVSGTAGLEGAEVPERSSIVGVIYFIVGLVVASSHAYLANLNALMPIVSAVLAVVLWPLVLLGVDLHLK
jgi:hypothetical protein